MHELVKYRRVNESVSEYVFFYVSFTVQRWLVALSENLI